MSTHDIFLREIRKNIFRNLDTRVVQKVLSLKGFLGFIPGIF